MKKSEKSLVEGMERIGLMASSIRKNDGLTPIEIDILLQELRDLYVAALQAGKVDTAEDDSAAVKAAEEQRAADEAAARKAAEEKKAAEEAAARKAAEEKRAAEEAAARKAAEEKKAAELAARKAAEEKKAAEEAAARKAAEEKKAAEIAARKAAEEKKAAEEAAARKAAEEKKAAEAAARKAAEEKKAAEEAAVRKAAEEEFNPVFAPAEPEKESEPIMPPILENIEGNPNEGLFADSLSFDEAPKTKQQESSLFDYLKGDKVEERPTVRTLADTLNHPSRNIEDQLETTVRSKKVDDLRTIININDKFSFMSELFRNNMKAYNDFILRLNSIAEREEALACVAEVAEQYKWDVNSLVVKNFYKIFDRKF